VSQHQKHTHTHTRSTQPSIPPESVNEYQLELGRQRQVWLIPIADERVGVQVKLWDPLRTRAIPERFCGRDSLRRGAISSVCIYLFTFTCEILISKYSFKITCNKTFLCVVGIQAAGRTAATDRVCICLNLYVYLQKSLFFCIFDGLYCFFNILMVALFCSIGRRCWCKSWLKCRLSGCKWPSESC